MRTEKSLWAVVVAVALLAAGAVMATAAPPAAAAPAGFQITQLQKNLKAPTNMEIAPDGRVFIAEMAGIIKVYDNVNDTTPTTFADLRSRVFSFDNRGLLGLALDPDWANTPWVYVMYAKDGPMGATPPVYNDACPTTGLANECTGSGRVARFSAATNTAGPEQILIEDWCLQWTSHGTGDLTFGSDGYLYASSGEGASASATDFGQRGNKPNACGDPPTAVGVPTRVPTAEGGSLRAQDVRTLGDPTGLSGSIIRVDKNTGLGAPDNPLAASSDLNAARIYSFGHRNPWRLTTRPGTSEVWIGDVGWNTWEEIDRIASKPTGQPYNFGWPCYEGTMKQFNLGLNLCESLYAQGPSAVQAPYFKYQQNNPLFPGDTCNASSSSVSGMSFYSGSRYPAAYRNALFFAEYARMCVYVMQAGVDGLPDPTMISTFFTGEPVIDIEAGPNGDLFMLTLFGATGGGGSVYRIAYPAGSANPEAVVDATPTSGATPLTVSFSATGSVPATPGDVLSYAWDLDGDNVFAEGTGSTATYTYTTAGVITARLRITDDKGGSDTTSVTITAGAPPVPTIDTPLSGTTWKVGDLIDFSGSALDEGTPMDASALAWEVILHHCDTITQCHTHPLNTFTGVTSGSFAAPDHEYPAYLELRLTATGQSGLAGVTSVNLYPQTVEVTIASSPPGLQATMDGRTDTMPFTRTEIVGASHTIDVATPQTLSGTSYAFGSWSDAGARVHDIVLDDTPATFTATFTPVSGPSPVLAYGFEGITGTAAPDSSGNNRAGVVSGALPIADGKYGQALSFDGINDFVSASHDVALSGRTGFTVEAWVRPRVTTGAHTIIAKERFLNYGWALDQRTLGSPRPSVIAKAATSTRTIGNAALPANTWSHVAATWDRTTLRLYVNGVQVGQKPLIGTITAGFGLLRIGGTQTGASWFNGDIDEVRVYNQAISAAQVATDMATPVVS